MKTNSRELSTTHAEEQKDPRNARLKCPKAGKDGEPIARARPRPKAGKYDEPIARAHAHAHPRHPDIEELYNYGRAPLNFDLADFDEHENSYGGSAYGRGTTTLSVVPVNANFEANTTRSLDLVDRDVGDNEQGTTTTPRNEPLRPNGDQHATPISNVLASKHEEMSLPVHPTNGTAPEQKRSRRESRSVNVTRRFRCCFGASGGRGGELDDDDF